MRSFVRYGWWTKIQNIDHSIWIQCNQNTLHFFANFCFHQAMNFTLRTNQISYTALVITNLGTQTYISHSHSTFERFFFALPEFTEECVVYEKKRKCKMKEEKTTTHQKKFKWWQKNVDTKKTKKNNICCRHD